MRRVNATAVYDLGTAIRKRVLLIMIEILLAITVAVISLIALAWQILSRRGDRKREDAQVTEEGVVAERRVAEALVHWLEGRRVLWTPKIEEIPEETVSSVLAIRKRVERDYSSLQEEEVRKSLNIIEHACLSLLNEPREHFRYFFSPEGERALHVLRQTVRPATEAIAAFYGLQPPAWQPFRGGFEGPSVEGYVPPPKGFDEG